MMTKLYKPSKYNLIQTNEDGETYIANGLYNTEFKFNKEVRKEILDTFNKNKIENNSNLTETLINNNFLIDIENDEILIADFKYNKLAYHSDVLKLTIIPTNSCNLKCVYCYETEGKGFLSLKNCDAIIKFIRKNINKYNGVLINFFGGEPLIGYNSIIYLMERLNILVKKFNKILIAGMTTNGVLLTKDKLENLIKNNVLYYQITLDGSKEYHDMSRPSKNKLISSFDAIYNNLIHAKILKRHFGIIIRMNVLYQNMEQVLKFIPLLKKDFFDDRRFALQVQDVRDWGGEVVKAIEVHSLEEYQTFLDRILDMDIDPFGTINTISDFSSICDAGNVNSFFIDYDLTVRRCSIPIYDQNKHAEYNNIGKLDFDGNMDLDDFKFSKWIERGQVSEDCYDCKYYPLCFSSSCPYAYLIKNKKNCEDIKFYVNYKMKYWSKRIKV